ncbi:general substrate transporter [Tuber brumale]|nr:general substrate transporter [Tuber brumale]
MNALGRKKILIMSASAFGLAGFFKASAVGAIVLTVGRFLGGIAAGSAAVIVPIYVNELAPPNSKGTFGALTQISINLGILSSQVLGIFLEKDGEWRFILLTGGMIGLVQAVGLLFLPESPSYLIASGNIEQARRVLVKVRGTPDVEDERQPYNTHFVGGNDTLLDAGPTPEPVNPSVQSVQPENTKVGLREFVTKPQYRAGFVVVAGVMLAQQLTGINAVVFYGVSILDDLLPSSAKYLNAAISAVNLLVTLGASFVFDRVSHRYLLLTAMVAMTASSATLALSIGFGWAMLSVIATMLFVSSFSMGLGLLPWMVASRIIEPNSVDAAQSIALTANWLGTFLVSFAVPVIAQAAGMPVVLAMFAGLGAFFYLWGLCFL